MRQSEKSDEARIVLGLLQHLVRENEPTHRSLASELGIALGLANAYLRRCVSKGFLKVKTTPARRYAYFLTQRGFAEKARLTSEYLSYSLSLFRQARQQYSDLLREAQRSGCRKVALAGVSDLAEIAIICAMDTGIAVVGIVDSRRAGNQLGLPVFHSFAELPKDTEALVITEMQKPREVYEAALLQGGLRTVLLPDLLGLDRSRPIRKERGKDA